MPSRVRSAALKRSHVLAVEHDLSPRGNHAGERAQGGGLAGAVRAEQRDDRAVLDSKSMPCSTRIEP